MAVIMGTSRIKAAVVSTNVPAMRRIRLISNNRQMEWVSDAQQGTGQDGQGYPQWLRSS